MLLKILLFLSILLNIFLVCKIVYSGKGINYITATLADIRNFGFSRRIHIGSRYKSLEKLGTELNLLMDRFQSTLEEKQKLEISHKQLISNISHDIRTPLTSLLGFVEVLQNSKALIKEEQQDYLNIIHSKGMTLYKMIQEFFEFSKLESEEEELKLDKIDLTDIIREVMASFYQDFITNKITPDIKLPVEPVYVWGNGISLERVLQNLISNALKYGKDGGVIGVSVRKERDKVRVDIWDKGKGILEKDMPFLFNRLYTAEPSRNETIRGSGLGLAIVKQLIQKQNGEISVTSIPGINTTFSFYLTSY